MADTLNTATILSLCATTGERVKQLAIKDGQLIFVQDKHCIALDFGGKRRFYTQIVELGTEQERKSILAPITGQYYFVIETAVFWTYQNGWFQITSRPEEIVFIGTELPELGVEQTLYVNKANRDISVWDSASQNYLVVANRTEDVPISYIESLFE